MNEQMNFFDSINPQLDSEYLEYQSFGGTVSYDEWIKDKSKYKTFEQGNLFETIDTPVETKTQQGPRKKKKNQQKEKYQSKNTGGRKQRTADNKKRASQTPITADTSTVSATTIIPGNKGKEYFDNLADEVTERSTRQNAWNDFYNQNINPKANSSELKLLNEFMEDTRLKVEPDLPFEPSPRWIPEGETFTRIHGNAADYFNKNAGAYSSFEDFMKQAKKDRRASIIDGDELKTIEKFAKDKTEWGTKQAVKEGVDELGTSSMKKIFNKRTFGVVLNAGFAISDYKDARQEGKGVIGSAVKAGTLFAAGEILQGAMLPVMLASSIPKAAVGVLEGAQRMTRQMNSTQRIQTFGDTYFQDTQQLATMRQAGMEMAKMSQYNLQQSIMGNEAQYMHKF